MLNNVEADKSFINIKIQQILSIIFSLRRNKDFRINDVADEYFKIQGIILVLITQNIKTSKIKSIDWENYNINNSNLIKVNLNGVDLTNADLYGIDLTDANLIGSILNNSDLREATLIDVDLIDAYLTGADFTNTEITGALVKDNLSIEQVKASKFEYI